MHCAGQPRAAWGAFESCSNPGSMSLLLLSGSISRHHHAEHPGWRLCLPSAGLVGLSLAYVLPVTGLLNGLLTSSAETGGLAWRGGGRWHALSCRDQAALALGHLQPCFGPVALPWEAGYCPTSVVPNIRGAVMSQRPTAATILTCAEQEMVAVERLLQYMALPPQPDTVSLADALPSAVRRPASSHDGDAGLKQPLMGGGNDSGDGSRGLAEAGSPGAGTLLARPEPGWLQAGHVVFQDVWLRYTPGGPDVLQGVSLDCPPGIRLGICGRTGGEAWALRGRVPDGVQRVCMGHTCLLTGAMCCPATPCVSLPCLLGGGPPCWLLAGA